MFKYFFLLFLLCSLGNHSYGQCLPLVTYADSCNFLAIGHRGYSAIYPENTLLGIEELFKRGIKFAEVDISLTKDGHSVLFHDEKSVYRTTNATGILSNYTLAEMQQWDIGSWKGSQFAGMRIATLEEALLVAEKYDAHLYLDLKNYNITSLKNALLSSGVEPNRLLPSIATLADAAEFRQALPNTPWIWYQAGNLPSELNNGSFYQQCVNLGCIAFEVAAGWNKDSNWTAFRTNVHQVGSKIVVFTLNDPLEIEAAINSGADGVESDRAWEAGKQICFNQPGGTTFDSATTGNWHFEGDLLASEVGSQLRNLNYTNPPTNQVPLFASCSVFNLPNINGVNKVVMKVPALTPENGLMVFNNFRIEDYGILDRSFSVIMDLLMPTNSANKWISLFQTSVTNTNDAELFINPSGKLGISGDYHGYIAPNTWVRVAFTVDCEAGLLKKYIDGIYVGASEISTDSRWAVWNSSRSGDDQGFLIFSDDDGETAEMYLSSMQIRNYIMDSSAINSLGGPATNGIKLGDADSWFAALDVAYADSTILDYENRTFYFVIPYHTNTDSTILSYQISSGATSNIPLFKKIAIAPMQYTWTVTSEDGLKKNTWKACIRRAELPTGLNHNTIQRISFEVYPNPAQHEVTLAKTSPIQSSYSIINLLGKTLQTGLFTQQVTLPLDGLTAGVYFIVVTEDGLSATKKLLVID